MNKTALILVFSMVIMLVVNFSLVQCNDPYDQARIAFPQQADVLNSKKINGLNREGLIKKKFFIKKKVIIIGK